MVAMDSKENGTEVEELGTLINTHRNGTEDVKMVQLGKTTDQSPKTERLDQSQLSKAAWVTVGILVYTNLLNYVDRFTLAGVLDDVKSHFVLTNEDAGLVSTVHTLAYMIFAPLFGYLGDRYSRRWGMFFGVGIWALATLAGSFVNEGQFGLFIISRAAVGVGQASFSTIAPTIISDLSKTNMRSLILAGFFFVLPIGSGMGYIVGAEAANLASDWRWSLRVTPLLGMVAMILIIFVMIEPSRGESDRSDGKCTNQRKLEATSYSKDIIYLLKNKSFMLSTMGFTSVAFVSGALAWWGPTFLVHGFSLQDHETDDHIQMSKVAFQFGVAMMLAGVTGVPLGYILSQKLRAISLRADPLICAVGLLTSAPLLYYASLLSTQDVWGTLIIIFFAMMFLNLSWCIVADILLYTVIPTRRATAQGMQILISFALGAAGSPYLIGVASDYIRSLLQEDDFVFEVGDTLKDRNRRLDYESLKYSLCIAYGVEVLGGIFFLLTAIEIVKDKARCDLEIANSDKVQTDTA